MWAPQEDNPSLGVAELPLKKSSRAFHAFHSGDTSGYVSRACLLFSNVPRESFLRACAQPFVRATRDTAALGMIRIQAVIRATMVRRNITSLRECRATDDEAAGLQDTMAA